MLQKNIIKYLQKARILASSKIHNFCSIIEEKASPKPKSKQPFKFQHRKKTTLDDTSEFLDEPEILEQKLETAVQLLQKSKHAVILTGAGISTDSGIPDYRSGFNTILQTGPGKWESEENKQKFLQNKQQPKLKEHAIKCFPNQNHLILSTFLKSKRHFQQLITSNVDNLHFQSGVRKEDHLELHGNITVENCPNCARTYYRDFKIHRVKNTHNYKEGIDHTTEQICQACNSSLQDNMVFFGEFMNPRVSQKSLEISQKMDYLLVIGSSLYVQSSAVLVQRMNKKNLPVVIMNLQKTPYDTKPGVIKINGLIKENLYKFYEKLGYKKNHMVQFQNKRYIQISFLLEDLQNIVFEIQSEDWEMTPKSFIKFVEITYVDQNNMQHEIYLQPDNTFALKYNFTNLKNIQQLKIHFWGHLDEETVYSYDRKLLEEGNYFSIEQGHAYIFLRTELIYDYQKHKWQETHIKDTYK